MNSNYDANLVYDFLLNTPESALKKMLIDKSFTDVHFNILLKVLRNSTAPQFCEHFYNSTFPKAKYNGNEINLKEKFWSECVKALNAHGLLSPSQKSAA